MMALAGVFILRGVSSVGVGRSAGHIKGSPNSNQIVQIYTVENTPITFLHIPMDIFFI